MENIYLPIEHEFINTQSRYRLAILAAQRTRQLLEGAAPTVTTRYAKSTSVALVEILKGDLEILYGKEAVKHQDEAVRIRKERKNRYLSPEREEELRKEIKKDLNIFMSDAGKDSPMREETGPTDLAD